MTSSDDLPDNSLRSNAAESDPERVMLRSRLARELTGEASFGSVKVLSHELADRIFTEKRRELLRTIANQDVSSQRELARLLDRDAGAVQRDLAQLIRADLIDIEIDGQANRPVLSHDTILIEPLVAPDNLGDEASYAIDTEP